MLVLTDTHKRAIELKYEGKTHQEISELLGNKLTKGTLDGYFGKDGMLYPHYLKYSDDQNDLRLHEAKTIFKREVANASKVILGVLYKAVKAGKDDKAFEYAKEILDRSGLVVNKNPDLVQNNQFNVAGDINFETLTDEQLTNLISVKIEQDRASPITRGETTQNQTQSTQVQPSTLKTIGGQQLPTPH